MSIFQFKSTGYYNLGSKDSCDVQWNESNYSELVNEANIKLLENKKALRIDKNGFAGYYWISLSYFADLIGDKKQSRSIAEMLINGQVQNQVAAEVQHNFGFQRVSVSGIVRLGPKDVITVRLRNLNNLSRAKDFEIAGHAIRRFE